MLPWCAAWRAPALLSPLRGSPGGMQFTQKGLIACSVLCKREAVVVDCLSVACTCKCSMKKAKHNRKAAAVIRQLLHLPSSFPGALVAGSPSSAARAPTAPPLSWWLAVPEPLPASSPALLPSPASLLPFWPPCAPSSCKPRVPGAHTSQCLVNSFNLSC